MSTRANIILKDGKSKLFFYRHSDGYPEGTLPTLKIFQQWLKDGKIRNNISQGSGWLVILGAIEYNAIPKFELDEPLFKGGTADVNMESIKAPQGWKVGAFEPTTCIHGDIEFLYTIDLEKKTIKVEAVDFNYETKKQTFTLMPQPETV